MTDGDVDKAKDILQTAPWSQAAYYRDKDAARRLHGAHAFSDAQESSTARTRSGASLGALGHHHDCGLAHIYSCNDFLPDRPTPAGYLAGVPWVLADAKDPTKEAADDVTFRRRTTTWSRWPTAAILSTDGRRPGADYANQSGPALLQALVAYSVQKEQGDAVERFVLPSAAVSKVVSLATHEDAVRREPSLENEAMFTVQTPKELANVSIPAVTGTRDAGRPCRQHAGRAALPRSPARSVQGGRRLDRRREQLAAADARPRRR